MNRPIAVISRIGLAIAGFAVLAALPLTAAAATDAGDAARDAAKDSSVQLLAQEDNDDDDDLELEGMSDDDDNDDDDSEDDGSEVELSESVRLRILERISIETGVAISELRIITAERATWTDGCLGLGRLDQLCTQALVPGYLVVVGSEERLWVYRTDEGGNQIVLDEAATATRVGSVRTGRTIEQRTEQRVEQRTTQTGAVVVGTETRTEGTAVSVREAEFSQTVQTAVFQAIAQRYQVSATDLRVVEVRRRVWANGCLGLTLANRACTQATVPGYLVVVRGGDRAYVYRTDLSGSAVYLDETASSLRTAQLRVRNTRVTFRDVPQGYWAADFIAQLAALDILDGYPDGLYRPDRPVTRAEFAAIIRRAFEETEVREAVRFLDVDRSYWAYTAIQETYQMGFLSGVAGNLFQPVSNLSRGDVLFALGQGLEISTASSADSLLAVYNSTNVSAEYRTLLAALTEQGIVVNYPDVRSISLERTVTRAEVAVIVYQTLVSLGRVEAIDSPYIVRGSDVVVIGAGDDDDSDIGGVDRDDDDDNDNDDDDNDNDDDRSRRNCNQGIGNGAEGCDPGNSRPRGGSNDEG